MTRILVCAGEASGDRLAADLLRELEARRPHLVARGLAGPAMRELGVVPIANAEETTAVGLVEVLGAVPRIWRILGRLEEELERWRPDLVLTVDSPDMMLRFGRRARRRGFRVVHWVSPQVWAWRPRRVHKVARSADCLLCLFPMEPALYAGTGVKAVFTGHPAMARLRRDPAARATYGQAPVIGLGPGSRRSEISALWPVYQEVARAIRSRIPDCRFVVPVASTIDRSLLGGVEGAVLLDGLEAAASAADVFLIASGTATLELAALGTPMVITYKVHPLTWILGRVLVRGVRHLGLPNVLAGREVVPERLQHLDPSALASELIGLLGDEGRKQTAVVRTVIDGLAGPGATARAADEVERWLEPRR
jgi:lipid-A-disaccharide synthase